MRLEYAVLVAGGMIALATWDRGANTRQAELCGRLIDKLPFEYIAALAKDNDVIRAEVRAVEEQIGISLARCRK